MFWTVGLWTSNVAVNGTSLSIRSPLLNYRQRSTSRVTAYSRWSCETLSWSIIVVLLVLLCGWSMATVVESQIVEDSSPDWTESLNDDDDETELPPPPSLPPPPRLSVDGRVSSPPPLPPPEPSSPAPSTAVKPPRNKQRYRVSDLELKSTLGIVPPVSPLVTVYWLQSRCVDFHYKYNVTHFFLQSNTRTTVLKSFIEIRLLNILVTCLRTDSVNTK